MLKCQLKPIDAHDYRVKINAAEMERLQAVGVTVIPKERRSADYLAKYIPSEIKKWEGPIKASGVQGE